MYAGQGQGGGGAGARHREWDVWCPRASTLYSMVTPSWLEQAVGIQRKETLGVNVHAGRRRVGAETGN